jgi:hypothetical protein
MTPVDDLEKIHFAEDLATSAKKIRFHVIENHEIFSSDDIHRLLKLMFDQPERIYYLFLQKNASLTAPLRAAIDSEDLLFLQADFAFYRHPKYEHDFLRSRSVTESFEWKREVAGSEPKYIRFTIILSKRKRRKMKLATQLAAYSEMSANALKLEPNFMDFGIDLRKCWTWLRRRFFRTGSDTHKVNA